MGGGDALLARDIDGDGVIGRANEISFVGYLAGARTDLEGLAAFDSNGNGLLDRLDARWQEFGAWRDANGDGMSAPGELRSLDDIGITQIGLQSDHQIRQFDGVTELGQSRFTWADGRTGAVGDVVFAADDTVSESAASLHAAVQQRQQAQAEFHARTSAERVDAIRKHDAARQELAKATQRRDLQTLRSPIDGVVQQLAVTTVGGVVTPAQPLMSVVPHNAVLEVDAQVLNRDIGHVKVGQRVINKVETFDFTRFGYIEGTVQWVGTDAVNDPKLGPVYPVRIRLNAAETPNTVNGLHGAVMAGMSVTADIRTGERRLIEYFIAPLLRYRQEALRER